MNQTQQLEKEKRSRNIFNYTVYADKQKLPVQFYGRPHLGFQLQEEFFPVHLRKELGWSPASDHFNHLPLDHGFLDKKVLHHKFYLGQKP